MGTIDITSTLNLVLVGMAVAAIAILGFIVYFNNKKSITGKSFLFFSIITVLWSIVNFFQYQIHIPYISFWILRLVIFFGTLHSFSFFQLSYVFPEEKKDFPKWYNRFLAPAVVAVAVITLTPLVFSHIAAVTESGTITKVANGPGIPIFGTFVLACVIGGIFLFVRKTIKAKGLQRKQFFYVMTGMIVTFVLLMIFNFLLPAFFDRPQYIPFGALFLLPFVVFTFYSIARHHLLDMKVVSTEILAFVLSAITLLEVIASNGLLQLVLRSAIFVLVLIFSVFLIKSVRKEVEQREQLQKLTENLEAANMKLEDLSRFKSQLLSLASHQIKSPLAAIKGFAQIILEGLYGPVNNKVKETVEKMKKSSDGLIGLIDTLLNLRQVDEGRISYQFVKTDIVKIVRDTADELRPLAEAKKLELKVEIPTGEIFANADGQKLKQVFQNLIDNAIKYTPTGSVSVSVREEGDSVIFETSDSGLGIPKNLLPHLFEEFIRDERVKKEILGTGLWLYIARKMIEAHGGQIGAESDGEGKGSKFWVRLKKIT